MKKRILSLVLALATVLSTLSLFAAAVPYSPSGNALKDFSQEHNYIYQLKKGNGAPIIDGKVSDNDGYGEPIAIYGYRYVATAAGYDPAIDQGEFKLKDDGTYYVYPTAESSQAIWDSIDHMETDNPNGYIWTYYRLDSTFSTSESYYFIDPETGDYVRAYGVNKDNFNNYTANNGGDYPYLICVQKLIGEPVDWETNFADYYTNVNNTKYYKPVEPGADGKAPAFQSGKVFYGETVKVDKFYVRHDGNSSAVGPVSVLKRDHTILPEEVKLYARYDDNYLYYAVEVTEPEHMNVRYNLTNYYGTNMSNNISVLSKTYDFGNYYRMDLDGKGPYSAMLNLFPRTYVSAIQTINNNQYVLDKFGNPGATYNDVQRLGTDFNVVHSPAEKKQASPEDEFAATESTNSVGVKESQQSGVYGKTVYEYRLPWKVINGKYDGSAKSPIPEMFTKTQFIQLENAVGKETHMLTLTIPRYASSLPGTLGLDKYTMRYMDDGTNLNVIDSYKTVTFKWRAISGTAPWNTEAMTSDYSSVDKLKRYALTQIPPIFFPAGQEPAEGYVQPSYGGAQIRVDGAEGQMMRIKINVPETDKAVAEVGAIVAPTEVTRNIQLRLGISSVAYRGAEYPVLYGVVDGKWINLSEDTDRYMGASSSPSMPNDSDSYLAFDENGGKPDGIYTVYTLPVANLEEPYDTKRDDDGNKTNIYTVVFGGPGGEGLFNDFDDYNTFYTIRPYVKYADGTVTYGEHEYKSLYYLACWYIQPMLTDYNITVVGTEDVAKSYNMDMMYVTTMKDAENKTMVDLDGKTIYIPGLQTSTSPYAGAAEYSIYWPERRAEVFRWYAVRTVSRRNNNTPLRLDDYETFDANTKLLVSQYEQMYENIWKVITSAEGNNYIH